MNPSSAASDARQQSTPEIEEERWADRETACWKAIDYQIEEAYWRALQDELDRLSREAPLAGEFDL